MGDGVHDAISRSAVLDWSVGWGNNTRGLPVPDVIWAGMALLLIGSLFVRDSLMSGRCCPGSGCKAINYGQVLHAALWRVYSAVCAVLVCIMVASVVLFWAESEQPSSGGAGPGDETHQDILVIAFVGVRAFALEGFFALLGAYFLQESVLTISFRGGVGPAVLWGALCGVASAGTKALVDLGAFRDDVAAVCLALGIAGASLVVYSVPCSLGKGRPAFRVWALAIVIVRAAQITALCLEVWGVVPDDPARDAASPDGLVLDLAFLVASSAAVGVGALAALRTDFLFLRLLGVIAPQAVSDMDNSIQPSRLGCLQWWGAAVCPALLGPLSVPSPLAFGPGISPAEGRGLRPPYACELCCRPEASSREVLRFDKIMHEERRAELAQGHLDEQPDPSTETFPMQSPHVRVFAAVGHPGGKRVKGCSCCRSKRRRARRRRNVARHEAVPGERRPGGDEEDGEEEVAAVDAKAAKAPQELVDAARLPSARRTVYPRRGSGSAKRPLLGGSPARGLAAEAEAGAEEAGDPAELVWPGPNVRWAWCPCAGDRRPTLEQVVGRAAARRGQGRAEAAVTLATPTLPVSRAFLDTRVSRSRPLSVVTKVPVLRGGVRSAERVHVPVEAGLTPDVAASQSDPTSGAIRRVTSAYASSEFNSISDEADRVSACLVLRLAAAPRLLDLARLRHRAPIYCHGSSAVFDAVYRGQPVASKVCASEFHLVARECDLLSRMPPHPRLNRFLGVAHSPPFVCTVYEKCAMGSLHGILERVERAARMLDAASRGQRTFTVRTDRRRGPVQRRVPGWVFELEGMPGPDERAAAADTQGAAQLTEGTASPEQPRDVAGRSSPGGVELAAAAAAGPAAPGPGSGSRGGGPGRPKPHSLPARLDAEDGIAEENTPASLLARFGAAADAPVSKPVPASNTTASSGAGESAGAAFDGYTPADIPDAVDNDLWDPHDAAMLAGPAGRAFAGITPGKLDSAVREFLRKQPRQNRPRHAPARAGAGAAAAVGARAGIAGAAAARGGYGTAGGGGDEGPEDGIPPLLDVVDSYCLLDARLALAMSWPVLARIGADVAEGLAALHEAKLPRRPGEAAAPGPLVHRDVKPENVFVDAWLRGVVGDFGTIRAMPAAGGVERGWARDLSGTTAKALTTVDTGTVGYQAPEIRYRIGTPSLRDEDNTSKGNLLERLGKTVPWAHRIVTGAAGASKPSKGKAAATSGEADAAEPGPAAAAAAASSSEADLAEPAEADFKPVAEAAAAASASSGEESSPARRPSAASSGGTPDADSSASSITPPGSTASALRRKLGPEDISTAVDVWSLGLVLARLASTASDAGGTTAATAHPTLRRLVCQCLQWDPKNRPTAREVAEAMGDLACEAARVLRVDGTAEP